MWYRIRAFFARWFPDPVQGVGFSAGELSSGELELKLDVEGRLGSVYLSRDMWLALGERAGWVDVDWTDD